MLARNGKSVEIDAVHSRAICEEIGDRLREVLRREVGSELPPRLHDLMERLARADHSAAPSIVPSLEDVVALEPRSRDGLISSR